jgi:hypothetical protein
VGHAPEIIFEVLDFETIFSLFYHYKTQSLPYGNANFLLQGGTEAAKFSQYQTASTRINYQL